MNYKPIGSMVLRSDSAIRQDAVHSDNVSIWAWLIVPLTLAVVLAVVPRISVEFYETWFEDEKIGGLQSAHWVIPLLGFIIAGRILKMRQVAVEPFLKAWVATLMIGCLYIAGEEASWGQHYFGWSTPESWMDINKQGETNLHNTSSWFNQKPRFLLELGIIVGGIVIPLLALRRPGILKSRWALVLPPLICLPTAVLAELCRVVDRLPGLFGSNFYIFYRASEVQETYFYIFILLYLIVLRRRLAALPEPARAK